MNWAIDLVFVGFYPTEEGFSLQLNFLSIS